MTTPTVRKKAMTAALAMTVALAMTGKARADALLPDGSATDSPATVSLIGQAAESHIRFTQVVEVGDRFVLRGRVEPANRSHVPRRLLRHIEVWNAAAGHEESHLLAVIPLRARQQFFAVRFHNGRGTAGRTRLQLRYVKGVKLERGSG